ncbi:MAG: GNAT family N-acetyltransferase [Chloroflexi bacterium]|nr:GNAT family N-acetyltransferase [Chloroflexota bacterium]
MSLGPGSNRSERLVITVVKRDGIESDLWRRVVELCDRAFDEDMAAIFGDLIDSTHVLAEFEGVLAGHACWVTRWLSAGGRPPLRTAYIEAVATEPSLQGRGIGGAVMERVGREVSSYELGGLCPNYPEFYARFGWKTWRGPLAIRTDEGLLETPDEHVMILRTPSTPEVDLDSRLTAEWRPGEVW